MVYGQSLVVDRDGIPNGLQAVVSCRTLASRIIAPHGVRLKVWQSPEDAAGGVIWGFSRPFTTGIRHLIYLH